MRNRFTFELAPTITDEDATAVLMQSFLIEHQQKIARANAANN